MNQILRNIVRSNLLKTLGAPMQSTVGVQTIGSRSLWHMSKIAIKPNEQHKCTVFGGCSCGCGKRFSSNGMKTSIPFFYKSFYDKNRKLHNLNSWLHFWILLCEIVVVLTIAGNFMNYYD